MRRAQLSIRWLVASAAVVAAGCHGNDAGRPLTTASDVLTALRTLPASPLQPALADGFQAVSGGYTPHFTPSAERATAHLVLPAQASGAAHLEDAATGLGVDVALGNARATAAETLGGYVVYPHAHSSGASLIHRALPSGTEDFLSFDARPAAAEIYYDLKLGSKVAGLRLVAGSLEMLDAGGAPRLRVAPPYVVGATGTRTNATLAVAGCAVDTNPTPPWGRAVTPPGAQSCTVRVTWPDSAVVYPAVLDPRWTTTTAMSTPRQGHTATLLPNGNVLVVGGTSNGTTALATAEFYNRTTATWSAANGMTGARTFHSATLLPTSSNGTTSGMVLIAGGLNGTTSQTSAQLYSPSAGTWATAGTLNAARHGHTATLLVDGRVLVVGGLNGTTTLNTAALYNPATGAGSWVAAAGTMGSALKGHAAALLTTTNSQLSNKVLVFGGNNGTATVSVVYLFDPAQNAFSTQASLSSAREGHTATVLANGNILVTGGKSGTTTLATTVLFNPTTGTGSWTSAGTMTAARQAHTATLIPSAVVSNGQVLVAGGSSGSATLTSAELWNGTTTWTATTALLSAAQGHTATLLGNDAILIAGGVSGTTTLGSAQLYDASFGLSCTSNTQCVTGFCVNGVCCDTACNGGCGACNLTGKVGTCSAVTSGTVCRASVGTCDVAETCNGTALTCPTDGFAPSTTVCRASAGTCDVAEKCTGTSASCPADGFIASGTVCRASTGTCDVAEVCSGTSAACPADGFAPSTTVCRAAAGTCDVAEKCTGTSTSCPADGFLSNGTVCRASTGTCDVAEICSGTSAACPADGFAPSTTVCRASAGTCDVAEKCSGTSATCPADGFLSNGTVCRPSVGVCDVAEVCSGASASCPSDGFLSNATVCRPSAGACDLAETCSGTAASCPTDGFLGPSTVCRAAAGTCDVAESCTGSSASCPTDGFAPSTTVCRPSAGACDVAENCSGTSASCPADHVLPVDTVCRPSAGLCDAPEVCGGVTGVCPPDQLQPAGTVCRAPAGVCDVAEICSGASASCPTDAFLPSTSVCRPAVSVCDAAENCTGSAATCPADLPAPSGTSCNDGNACTQTDACQGFNCVGTNPITCAAPDQCRSGGTCNPANGTCTTVAVADGQACDDGDRCTVGDSCHAGTCLPGAATGCSGAGAANYVSVIDLGSGQGWSYATDINNSGEVIGSDVETTTGIYQFPFDGSRAFTWTASGGISYLPWPGAFSYASAINDSGVISGSGGFESGPLLAFRYDPLTDVQPVYQSVAGNGGGINAGGTMTGGGYYLTPGGGGYSSLQIFRIGTGEVQVLPSAVGGGQQAYGSGIADDGTIVGAQLVSVTPSMWEAIRYSDSRGTEVLNDLLPPGTGWNLTGAGYIKSGVILGGGLHNGLGRAYRLRVNANGDFVSIDDLGISPQYSANAVNFVNPGRANAAGEIVGAVFDSVDFWPQDAFVYTDATGMVDLTGLIDPNSGWHLNLANAINDNHEVVGYGSHNGLNRAFKLTLPTLNVSPCPPPADACHTQGTRDLLTGLCSTPAVADGTTCNDGNACTTGEACHSGVCGGGTTVVCPVPDQCHTGGGTCDPGIGCTGLVAVANGTPCNDSNSCTQSDTCQAGACVGAPIQCAPSDGCHAPSTCDPASGTCRAGAVLSGTCELGTFDYDKAGRLIHDRGAAMTYDGYDQLRTVTPIASAPVPVNIEVEEIGNIDGGNVNAFPAARAINAKAHVTGWATLTSGATHAYIYVGSGQSIDINAAAAIPTELDGYGITSNDTVGGGYFDASGVQHLFTYSQAQGFQDLGAGPAGTLVNPQELNDSEQFTGSLTLPGGASHGFRFTPGQGYEDIGTLGGQNSFGYGIDDSGTVLSSAQTADSPSSGFEQFGHATMYNSVVGLVDLNRYVDPTSGLVLVTTFRSAGNWISGTATESGINSGYRLNLGTGMVDNIAVGNGGSLFGFGVNSYGEVVGDGTIDGPGQPSAAYIFTDQLGLRKLNDLIDPSSGWNLTNALGIDDNGDVTGTGYLNGRFAAFILRLPLRTSTGGAPTVAVAHTYGYDGLRTSTTNGPGTTGASVQFWFTQDYSQHDGVRDHYVRIGDRIVAKVTYNPPPGGGGMGMAAVGAGLIRNPGEKVTDLGDLIAKIVLGLLLAGGLSISAAGFVGKKRRPAWVAATAGPVALFFVASCEMLGLDKRQSAATLWQRVQTVYFHQGIAAGPVLTTDSSGSLKEERRYEPFGQPIDANLGGSIGPVDFRREGQNSLGKMTDPVTGWSYHGARWMLPQTARWSSPDWIAKGNDSQQMESPWEMNPYAYVGQRPTRYFDPNGLDKELYGLPAVGQVQLFVRSYAPFETFGGGYAGDNRGPSTDTTDTARVTYVATIDLKSMTVVRKDVFSDPSSGSGVVPQLAGSLSAPFSAHWTAGPDDSIRGTAHPTASTTTQPLGKPGHGVGINADIAGSNPLVRGAADIDIHANVTVQKTDNGLTISGTLTGDAFPNAEIFIRDANNNAQMIYNFDTQGGQLSGPYVYLPGNNYRDMGSFSSSVNMGGNGLLDDESLADDD